MKYWGIICHGIIWVKVSLVPSKMKSLFILRSCPQVCPPQRSLLDESLSPELGQGMTSCFTRFQKAFNNSYCLRVSVSFFSKSWSKYTDQNFSTACICLDIKSNVLLVDFLLWSNAKHNCTSCFLCRKPNTFSAEIVGEEEVLKMCAHRSLHFPAPWVK